MRKQAPSTVEFHLDVERKTPLLAFWEGHVVFGFPGLLDNVMVSGSPGLGKSEFINNAFLKGIDGKLYRGGVASASRIDG